MAGNLPAQSVPAATAAMDQPVIELSPFVVDTDKDEGWIASNTMLSSRTNQPLKEVPVTIESMTQEFMLDMGIYDVFSAAEWAANSQVVSLDDRILATGNPPPDTNRYSYRGIPNEGGPTRNLFSWGVPSDSYNVERIDFGRGSNSLLFGDAEPGGQANIYTKRARIGRNFGQVLAQVGSFDSYRMSFDYNRSFSDKFAARVNLTKNYGEAYYDHFHQGLEAGHVTVTYQPFKNTVIRVEGEYGQYERNLVTNNLRVMQNAANGRAFNARWTILPDKTVIDNRTLPAVDRQNVGGAVLSYMDVESGIPREMMWDGFRSLDQEYDSLSVYVEQRIGGLGLEFAGIRQNHTRLQDQARGNNRVRIDSAGRPHIDLQWANTTHNFTDQAFRTTAVYNWTPFNWMSQLFVANAVWTDGRRFNEAWQERNYADSGGAAPAAARPVYRVYLDDPSHYAEAFRTRHDVPASPTVDIRRWTNQFIEQKTIERNYSFSASGRYFNGKLFSNAGVRLDRGYRITTNPWQQANRGPDGEAIYSGRYEHHPERFTLDPALSDVDEITQSYGLTYNIQRNVNAYVVLSESFRQANGAAVDFTGDPIGQQRGDTFEVGIKADFFNRKLSWNLNYYDLERSNVEFNMNLQGMTIEELEDVLNPNNLNPGDAGYIEVFTPARDKRKQFSEGFETTFTFFPGEGWNIRLSGAVQDVKQDEAMEKFKQHIAAAIERGDEDPALIAGAQDIVALSGRDGEKITGGHGTPFSFSYAVNYRFNNRSRFKGISLGVNGKYSDDYIFRYLNDEPVYGGKRFTTNGFAGYRAKLFGRNMNLRLNVTNLIKEKGYVTVSDVLVGGVSRNVHAYPQPRTFLLTTTMDF
jgi:outer membrane receptor protein involved in Fe transport